MFYPKSIQVHSGTFHADDVICCVQAKILNNSVRIMRTDRNLGGTDIKRRKIVADVGGGLFDHHQKGAKVRNDGIKHCAASLLWEFWGEDIIRHVCKGITEEQVKLAWKDIDDNFMRTLAVIDNGIILSNPMKFESTALSIANIAGNFNPTWMEGSSNQDLDNKFREAVETAKNLFKRYIINCIDNIIAQSEVEKRIAYSDKSENKGILVLDKYISWENAVLNHENILCVIYPSLRKGWNLQLAPAHAGSFETRIRTPKEWRGYKSESGEDALFDGMVFCHNSGFLTAFKSREQAINAAKYLVEFNSK